MPMLVRCAIALLMVLLMATGAHATLHIRDTWPDSAAAAIQPQEVTFQSSDPFSPAAAGHAPARMVKALLFMPPGAPPDHTTPAVVMLHGSAGLIADRAKYGPQLAAMGVAVLLVETYDSRRDLATSFIDRVLNITETMFVADAYAGLHYLASRPEIDAHHVVLAGFSYGRAWRACTRCTRSWPTGCRRTGCASPGTLPITRPASPALPTAAPRGRRC